MSEEPREKKTSFWGRRFKEKQKVVKIIQDIPNTLAREEGADCLASVENVVVQLVGTGSLAEAGTKGKVMQC